MHQEFQAPAALRDAIHCFWYTDRPYSGPAVDIVPDGYAEIVFCFGDGCSLDGRRLPSPFLMGLLTQPLVLSTTGRLQVLGIRCYPWTVFEVLGLAPGRDGARVFAHPVARLQGPLQ